MAKNGFEMEQILMEYFENKIGTPTIGKKYNISPITIQEWLRGDNRKNEVNFLMKKNNWVLNKSLKKEIFLNGHKVRGLNRRKLLLFKFNKKMAYMFGAIFGDGSVSEDGISFNLWDYNFAKECLKNGEGGFHIKCMFKISYCKNNKTKYYRVNFYSRNLRDLFKKYKKSTQDWFIPKEINNNKLKINFLKGFFDAEGCAVLNKRKYKDSIYKRFYVSCSSTSLNGLKQVSNLLNDLKIHHGFYSCKNNYEYRIVIYRKSLERFNNMIGFRIEKFNFRLNSYLKEVMNNGGTFNPRHRKVNLNPINNRIRCECIPIDCHRFNGHQK
jgi:intein-encoded DNA endonuclease-like protein